METKELPIIVWTLFIYDGLGNLILELSQQQILFKTETFTEILTKSFKSSNSIWIPMTFLLTIIF